MPCCGGENRDVAFVDAGTSSPAISRLDHTKIAPGSPGMRFNASLIEHDDGYALAYRDGWKGSQIWITRLSRDLSPIGAAVQLRLRHRDANYGREDPRLFRLNGHLHVSFIGVVGGKRIRHTNQLFARLSKDFRVEDVFHPAGYKRQPWEKNHAYFDVGGIAHAVYSISPHRILRIEGNAAQFVANELMSIGWSGGVLRGGAPPVLVGAEYWHFFHGRRWHAGATAYNLGLYTFDSRPPWRPLRMIREPLLWADHSTKPKDQYVSCIFACGAVRNGDEWIISSGEHDRWIRFDRFSHADLDQRLEAIR